MRILLVQPPVDPVTSACSLLGIPEPLSLEHAAAGVQGHEVRLLDLRIEGDLAVELEQFSPRIVATTAVTATLRSALEVLEAAKRSNPEIVTVIGGIHPTLAPADCQKTSVDIAVRGDGELTFAEIVAAIEGGTPLSAVQGIAYRDHGTWTLTPNRPLAPLDSLPLPARHLVDHHRHAFSRLGLGSGGVLTIVSSRGCCRRCNFCSLWRTHGGKYRTRSPENVVEEIAARAETFVDFVDDDSFGDARRMRRLRELLDQTCPGRQYKAMLRADTVAEDPELFERWAESGLKLALVGLESFQEDELRGMNKSANAAQNIRALEVLQGAGIGVIGYLLVRPDFDGDDFRRLSDTVQRLAIRQPVFTTLTPYPGTVLFDEVKEHLTTRNWDRFDGVHAVVKTRLPSDEFYRQLAKLYRDAYRASPYATVFESVARVIEGYGHEPEPRPPGAAENLR